MSEALGIRGPAAGLAIEAYRRREMAIKWQLGGEQRHVSSWRLIARNGGINRQKRLVSINGAPENANWKRRPSGEIKAAPGIIAYKLFDARLSAAGRNHNRGVVNNPASRYSTPSSRA